MRFEFSGTIDRINENSPLKKMTDRQALLDANESFYRAFEKRDLDAMTKIWSQGTASLCIHPGRQAIEGWQQIRASWEKIFKATHYLEIDLDIVRVEVYENFGYIVAIENLLQINGGRKLKAQSMATNLFEYLGGSWYLIHHHGSPII